MKQLKDMLFEAFLEKVNEAKDGIIASANNVPDKKSRTLKAKLWWDLDKVISDNNFDVQKTWDRSKVATRELTALICNNSDEFYNIIELFIKYISGKYSVEYDETEGLNLYGRIAKASGTYSAIKLKVNGETFYITLFGKADSNGIVSILGEKSLTPDDFGFAGKIFLSDKDVLDAVLNSNLYNKIQSKNSYITEFISTLIDAINASISIGLFTEKGAFSACSINQFFSNKTGKLTINFESNYIDKLNSIAKHISDKDINIIGKNFGEILEPYILFLLYKNVDKKLILNFPAKSNYRTIDYIFNSNLVSAKFGGGANASGIGAWEKYNSIIKEFPEYRDSLTPMERNFIDEVMSTYEFPAMSQYAVLTQRFILDQDKELRDFINIDLSNIKPTKDNKELEKIIDELISRLSDDTIVNWFEEYYKLAKYKPGEYTPDKMSVKFIKSLSPGVRIGIMLYPLWNKMKNAINSKYKNEITSVINKLTNFKQIYLKFSKTKNGYTNLELQMHSSNTASWEMANSSIGTKNYGNNKFGIAMCKK
jgi:hypothetical protein